MRNVVLLSLFVATPVVAAPRVKFIETVLGRPPALATPRMGFSADGKRVGWAARDGAKARIEINGTAAFTAEKVERIFFTPDSSRWIALERRGPKWHVIVDGTAGPAFDRVENFVFDPSGSRVAYVGTLGTRQVAVIDGVQSPDRDFVFGLTWAGDGRVMFAGYDGGRAQLVIDGKAVGAVYRTMSAPAVSDDGKSVATTVQRLDGPEQAVVDGVEGRTHAKALALTMSRDGKHTAYVGLDDLARVYVDGTAGAAHTSAGPVVFSPDGKRVAYVASTEENKMFAVVDGVADDQHTRVEDLKFSPDSRHLLYHTADVEEGVRIVVDSREHGPFETIVRTASVFGAGGARWATVAVVRGKKAAVIDGVTGKSYDDVGPPAFSPDGRIVAYTAIRGGQTFLIINGTEHSRYKRAILTGPPPHFTSANTLRFHVRRGPEIVRVDAEITP